MTSHLWYYTTSMTTEYCYLDCSPHYHIINIPTCSVETFNFTDKPMEILDCSKTMHVFSIEYPLKLCALLEYYNYANNSVFNKHAILST